jgi:hypothetical protein
MMHLEYVQTGPTEVGRSGSYEDIEVMFDLTGDVPVVWFIGRIGEDWGEIANVEPRPDLGSLGVASWEGGAEHHTGYLPITSVFVSAD